MATFVVDRLSVWSTHLGLVLDGYLHSLYLDSDSGLFICGVILVIVLDCCTPFLRYLLYTSVLYV